MQERLYRSLYETVRKQKLEEIDFSMNANLSESKTKKNEYGNCFFSKTELWFYLPLAIVTAGIIIITHI